MKWKKQRRKIEEREGICKQGKREIVLRKERRKWEGG